MNITMNQVKEIKNNQKIVDLISNYLILSAKLKVIGPKVEKIQNDLLKGFKFHKKERNGSIGELITDPKILYRAIENTDEYYEKLNKIIMKQSYAKNVKDGYCPKLILEHDIIMVKKEVVDIVRETFNMPEIWDMNLRKELFDNTLKFVA